MIFDTLMFLYLLILIWNSILRLSFNESEIPYYVFPYFKPMGIFFISTKAILSANTAIYF